MVPDSRCSYIVPYMSNTEYLYLGLEDTFEHLGSCLHGIDITNDIATVS